LKFLSFFPFFSHNAHSNVHILVCLFAYDVFMLHLGAFFLKKSSCEHFQVLFCIFYYFFTICKLFVFCFLFLVLKGEGGVGFHFSLFVIFLLFVSLLLLLFILDEGKGRGFLFFSFYCLFSIYNFFGCFCLFLMREKGMIFFIFCYSKIIYKFFVIIFYS
jgi:hypothetical protein